MKITKLENGNFKIITDTMLNNGEYRQAECVYKNGVLKTRLSFSDGRLAPMPHNIFKVICGPKSKKILNSMSINETVVLS